jgi:hypothetical protein
MSDLSFDVSNPQTPNAGPVIYISNDPDKWGRLTITLKNTRTDDIKLDPSDKLQIYFEMLTLADVKRIKVPDNSAWAGGLDATGGHIELHPRSTITIHSRSSISFELNDVLGETPRQGKFRFYYPSLKIRNVAIQGVVQRPPADAGKQWGLAWTLDPRAEYQNRGNTIYVTASGKREIENYLLVHLYRSARGTLPSGGTPRLSFSFLTGDDDLALCSEDRLKKVTARIAHQRPAGRWKDPARDEQGEDVVWTVAPTDGGGDLFGAESLLILRFDHIVTDLPAGGSGVLYIQYAGLTDYDDGYLQVPIEKITPVLRLRKFRAVANGQPIGNDAAIDYAPVTLEWDVIAADYCQLRRDNEPSERQKDNPGSKTLTELRPFQKYTLEPIVADVVQPGWSRQFHVNPPTAKLTAEHIGAFACLEWQADFDRQFTLRYPDGRIEMGGSTGWMEAVYDSVGSTYSYIFESDGKPYVIKIRVVISARLKLSWTCTGGDHCMLYVNDVPIGGRRPLVGSYVTPIFDDANLDGAGNVVYRIECVGAGPAKDEAHQRTFAHKVAMPQHSKLDCTPEGLPEVIVRAD